MDNKQLIIYKDIHKKILTLHYKPNEALSERKLSNHYSTSRTTVRQVLQKLTIEKKILILPRSKTIIPKISLQKIKECVILRNCLEQTMAVIVSDKLKKNDYKFLQENINNQKKILKLSSKSKIAKFIKLDNNFHRYLFKVAGLNNLWVTIQEYIFDYDRTRYLSVFDYQRAEATTREHYKIFTSLKKNNKIQIKKNIRIHFNNASKYTFSVLVKKNKEYFI